MTNSRHGTVITFYSFTGGTGRTMALANVAWILAANGHRVLVADWHFESPGLHRYFRPFIRSEDIDAFGNHVTRLEYDLPHDRLEVLAEAGVEVQAAPETDPKDSDEWEAVGGSLAFSGRPVRAAR